MIPTKGSRLPPSLRAPGRNATVLLTLHDQACKACSNYVALLEKHADEMSEWDGRVKSARDVATENPAVTIADQWGEIAVTESAGEGHTFIEPAEVVEWLRFLAMKCPECEGEAL